MKKKILILTIGLIIGFVMAGAAVFADAIGIIQRAEWGRARMGLFLFGVFVIVCAILYYQYINKIDSILLGTQRLIKSFPPHYLVFLMTVMVIIIYVWFGSSGKWTNWKSSTYYYDNLARSFLNSTLYLPLDPDPKLLALPNPYDPLARAGIDMPVDVSFYEGKFYIYWGPVPALILTAIYTFFQARIGDYLLTFGFVCGIFLVQTSLLFFIWKRYFYHLPKWTLYLSVLLLGLGGSLMLLRHNYESAKIYEASITGAQFFFMSGLLAALTAATRSSISAWRLAIAGILWALAIGTRQILAVPIGFIIFALTVWIYKTEVSISKKSIQLLSLALPLLVGFICLGWYNWARFGSVTESGLYYQLAGVNLQEHYRELFSAAYVFQNLYNYLFNAIEFTKNFPFVFLAQGTETPFFSFYSVPAMYYAQPIAGILYTFPFAIFSSMPFFAAVFKWNAAQNFIDASERTYLNLILCILYGSFLLAFGFLLLYFWVGIRFLGDVLPALMTLSIIGFWQGYPSLKHSRLYAVIAGVLASASVLIGILLAISTNSGLVKLMIQHFPFLPH